MLQKFQLLSYKFDHILTNIFCNKNELTVVDFKNIHKKKIIIFIIFISLNMQLFA